MMQPKKEVDGWYKNVKKPSKEDLRIIKEAAKYYDPQLEKKTLKLNRYMNDEEDPAKLMKMMLFNTTLNLDGIWGGYTGLGCKTVVPHEITSKHNVRSIPNQEKDELVRNIRRHLDRRGYRMLRYVSLEVILGPKLISRAPWQRL